jgi:hypothetical protein
MKIALCFCLILFVAHISGCSKAAPESNAATSGLKPADNALLNSEMPSQKTPNSSIEQSSSNSRDVVLFDGKNYIKKSGWKTPSKNDTYVDKNYNQSEVERVTKSGKQIKTNMIQYGYRTPWLHSQDFYYEGGDLDYLKGKLEATVFIEMSANRKVFLYSIFVQKVVSPIPSNSDSHETPFGYQIMDADGDGIFETLLGVDGEIVVPD